MVEDQIKEIREKLNPKDIAGHIMPEDQEILLSEDNQTTIQLEKR